MYSAPPIARLLLASFLVQVLGASLTVGYFYGNRATIAEAYCVNKTEPNSCCAGKCYLEKNLEQQKEHSDEQQQQEEAFSLYLELSAIVCPVPMAIEKLAPKQAFHYLEGKSDFCHAIDLPPPQTL